MKRALASLLTFLMLLAVTSCAGGTEDQTIAPGEGPAATLEPSEGSEPTTEESVEPEIGPAKFGEKVTYKTGIVVEVIRIKHTKLSESGSAGEAKVGSPMQVLSIRVKNGAKKALNVHGATALMTYGPDGDQAEQAYDTGVDGMSGKVLPGRARTGTFGFIVPAKYLDDVTLEFSWDSNYEHDSAVFVGSIK